MKGRKATMENQNKYRQPVIILGVTILILYMISFLNPSYEIGGLKIKAIDLFSDIKNDSTDIQSKPLNQLNKMQAVQSTGVLKAGIGLNFPLGFGFDLFNAGAAKNENSPAAAPLQGRSIPITGNIQQLNFFFDALRNVKSKSVRVAHYGDSAIEGDLITSDIREALQNRFGGNGVGWLSTTSQDITFRTTTKQTFSSGNWDTGALYTSNPKALPLGISGVCCVPKGNAWVQYETTPSKRYLRDFSIAKLYYSNAKSSSISYSFDGGPKQTVPLKTGNALQELLLKPSGQAKSIRIEFPVADQAYVYGVSLENGTGIYVDNLPLRGNTGVDLGSLQQNVLKDFSKYLDYKLIILEFGLNIAGTSQTDYSWYEREMVKVINHLKTAFPKTSILMISVHDKATKKGTVMVTDPAITKLLEAQKNIAKQSGVALWSLFDAMGGENSMPKWVDANPPLAFKDYIHFNDQGAKKVADLLTTALLSLYK
jgi:lysophospholipase L1-like esterase